MVCIVCMISVYAVWKHTHSRYMFTCCSNKKQVSSNLALFTDIVQKEPPPLVDAITESVDGWLLLKWHIHILLTHYCNVIAVYYWFLYKLFHFIIIQSADADHCSEFRSRVCGATLSKFAGQCQPHLQGPPAYLPACLTNTVCLEIFWNRIYPIFLYIHLWNSIKFIGTWTVWYMYVCMHVYNT